MEFVLKATQESRGKKKLKHLIILTARALIIAGLVFAFSDPSMELVTNEGTSAGGKSKRQLAIESVQKTMEDMPETRLILIDSATSKRTEITNASALSTIAQTNISHKSADIPKLISAAATFATTTEEELGNAEIWVASDLQASDWNTQAKQWRSVNSLIKSNEKVKLRFIALNETSDSNNAVRVLKSWREGNELIIDAQIYSNSNGAEEAITLTYSVNGGMQTDDITIDSSQKTIRKRIPLQNSVKNGFGYVSINADANVLDNVAYFSFGEKASLKTIIVSEGGQSLLPLKRAAAVPSFDHLEATVVSPDGVKNTSYSDAALVIWQAPLPEGSQADKLNKYIESGGLAIFFPPEQESLGEYLGIRWGPVQKAIRDTFFVIDSWNQNDGPFRNGISGQSLPMEQIDVIARRQIVGDTISLANYEDGKIFSTRKILGLGRAIFISALPDLKWSHMEHSAVHLLVIHRMLEIATDRLNANSSAIVGAESLQPKLKEQRVRIDDYSNTEPNNADNEAGVYRLGDRVVAANRPILEDHRRTWQ